MVVSLAAVSPAASQVRGFVIDRFSVTIEVHADGSLMVREAITFEFRGSHQGIFRTIPVRYHIPGGFEYALRLDEIRVVDETLRPLRTEVSYPGRYVRIKAWVPGAQDALRTLTVSYRVRRGLLTVDDHQELYWNVTGNEWEVPIRAAEALIASPPGVSPDAVRSAAYTGYLGQAGSDFSVERAEHFLTVRTTRALRPREGLTVALAWPPGAIRPAGLVRRTLWFLGDNWPLGLPALTLGLALWAWRRFGRDPAVARSIKPEYAPPPNLTPAEAGALVGERAQPRDAVATLVDLAVRGYLRIDRVIPADDGDFRLVRLKPWAGDTALTAYERFLLGKVFGAEGGVDARLLSEIRRDYDVVFPSLRDSLYAALVARGLFPVSPEKVRGAWLAVGLVILVAGVMAFVAWPARLGELGAPFAIGLGASGALIALFSPVMPRKTRRGVQLAVQVRGFQEFLERAEKDRLARMPADTLHRFLPWAIALGVVERWILNFEGLAVDPPIWLGGGGRFSLPTYHRMVSDFSSRAGEAIVTGRRGAGGGGWSGGSGFSGGSSGGGMGGGGGGTF
ncbi:MAG TPA: DUF2207 domain-containing protein [Methylomirabilota bacterium]|nr:DUF2207 domain-containing protein [Methylomirabilota bacterium]